MKVKNKPNNTSSPHNPGDCARSRRRRRKAGSGMWKCSACDYRRTETGRVSDGTRSGHPAENTMALSSLRVRRTPCPFLSGCRSEHAFHIPPPRRLSVFRRSSPAPGAVTVRLQKDKKVVLFGKSLIVLSGHLRYADSNVIYPGKCIKII